MIEKLDVIKHTDNLYDKNGFITNVACGGATISKVNELIDAVNTIQKEREAERFEIQERIDILEAVRKSVNKLETMAKNTNTVLESLVQENNIHEKQINELQMKLEPEKCKTRSENVQPDAESRSENVQDKFAQYRDWAGKLCRFWNVDKDKAIYGILEEVKADWAYRFQKKGENYLFDHCEPVKPDEDIIYRGE